MCFYTRISANSRKPKPKVAIQDIECWKIILKTGKGLFFSMRDKEGKLMKWVKGWHYYETDKTKQFTLSKDYSLWTISKGFHSYKKEESAVPCSSEKRIRCVIPKGALYYENDSQYCSNEIVYP